MPSINRRRFLRNSLLGATAVSVQMEQNFATQRALGSAPAAISPEPPGIIDTNVNLFEWPFRALKYRDPKFLVAKLKRHRIVEAWAGSFEALLAKDMNGVNERLATACRDHGAGFLIPFGSVNLAWPDWQEDLRRCHEVYNMPGVRIYPGYQPFALDHPDMPHLVRATSDRGLILQIVFGMEDPRVHHPIIDVRPVALGPLLQAVDGSPDARIELLHFPGAPTGDELSRLMAKCSAVLDISRLEGNGALGRMIGAVPGSPSARVPLKRIVFGSHVPYFPVETALLKLIESPLDENQLYAVMQGNARRLLSKA